MTHGPIVGAGQYRYELLENWARPPEGWKIGQTSVVTDSQDRVYLYNRSEHPLMIFDSTGNFIGSWDEDVVDGLFGKELHPEAWAGSVCTASHGLFIDDEDSLYLPVWPCHVVLKCDLAGNLLMTMGTWDTPSNPDWNGKALQFTTDVVPRSYGPFCLPTDVGMAPDGTIYVTDGYTNASVHRFTPDGELIATFGRPGKTGPSGHGAFHLPHGIWVHSDGRLFVADRHNDRVQIFSAEGTFLEEWGDLHLPCDVYIDEAERVYVAELGGDDRICSILSITGEVLARLGQPANHDSMEPAGAEAGPPPARPRTGGHNLWVDSQGSIYVNRNAPDQRITKYVRV